MLDWEKEGVNYWENPDCPKEYLEASLVELVDFVEDVQLPANHFQDESREEIAKRVGFYEDVADK